MVATSFFSPTSSSPTENRNVHMSEKVAHSESAMSLSKSPVTVRSKLNDTFFQVYYYQIRGNKILKYSYSEFRSSVQKEQVETLNEQKNETYRGEMTFKSARKLKKKIEIWYEAVEQHNNHAINSKVFDFRRFVFLTVTLSSTQIHSDQQIKHDILKPFFRVLRDRYNCRNYIWKAESQENGNIHFHILLDRFIDKEIVQSEWNKCQNALGYVDEFKKKFKHCHPPSTQIEAVKNQKTLILYFEKYIAKSDSYRKIEGAVWKGSQSVMSLQFFEFVGDSEIEQNIIKAENENKIKRFDETRYSIYTVQNASINEILPLHVVNQRIVYWDFLTSFLFGVECVKNFRDYCYLFSVNDVDEVVTEPQVARNMHPLPVQLNLFEVKELFNYKKLRRL